MKKPDPKLNEMIELHKVAPQKVITKDKLVALAKKQFVSILKPGKKKKKTKSIDGASTIGGTSHMSSTVLTEGDDIGMDLDDDGNILDATMKTDGIEFGEDGEPLDADDDKDDEGDEDSKEAKEEEGGDNEEAKDEEATNEDKAEEGVNGSEPTSPKKLRKSLSKSPSKKKKKVDENEIEMIGWKTSEKVKGRLVVDKPIKVPEAVTWQIQNDIERWENGIDSMNDEDFFEVINKFYRTVEKKKLIKYTENQKMKPNLSDWHKMIIHLAMNIGPQTGINEDIIEEMKEEQDGEFKELNLSKHMTQLPAGVQRLDVGNLNKLNSSNLPVPSSDCISERSTNSQKGKKKKNRMSKKGKRD